MSSSIFNPAMSGQRQVYLAPQRDRRGAVAGGRIVVGSGLAACYDGLGDVSDVVSTANSIVDTLSKAVGVYQSTQKQIIPQSTISFPGSAGGMSTGVMVAVGLGLAGLAAVLFMRR